MFLTLFFALIGIIIMFIGIFKQIDADSQAPFCVSGKNYITYGMKYGFISIGIGSIIGL